jgi:hypothetical protein
MFAILAAVFFGIAFVLNGAATTITSHWFTPTSLMLAGLFCVALHLVGVGANWTFRRAP